MKKLGSVVIFLGVLVSLVGKGEEFFPIQMYHINRNWTIAGSLKSLDTLAVLKAGINVITHAYPTLWWVNNFNSAKMMEFSVHRIQSGYGESYWYGKPSTLIPFFPIHGVDDSLAWWNYLAEAVAETLIKPHDGYAMGYKDSSYAYWVIDNDMNKKLHLPMLWWVPAAESLCAKLKSKDPFHKTVHYGKFNGEYLDSVPDLDIVHTGPLGGFHPSISDTNIAEVQEVLSNLATTSNSLSNTCKNHEKEWMGYLNVKKLIEIDTNITVGGDTTIDTVGYRHPTEAELRAISCISLAYGAKGLFYSKYDSYEHDEYGDGIISPDPDRKPYMPKDQALIDSIFGPGVLTTNDVDSTYTIYSDFWRLTKDLKVLGPKFRGIDWDTACSMKPIKTSPLVNEWNEGLGYVKRVVWQDGTPTSVDIGDKIYGELALFTKSSQEYPDYFFIVNRHTKPEDTVEVAVWIEDNYADTVSLWGIDMLTYAAYLGCRYPDEDRIGLGPFIIPPGDGKLIWLVLDTSGIDIDTGNIIIGRLCDTIEIIDWREFFSGDSACYAWADSINSIGDDTMHAVCRCYSDPCAPLIKGRGYELQPPPRPCEPPGPWDPPHHWYCIGVAWKDRKIIEELKVSVVMSLDSLKPTPLHWGIGYAGLFLSRNGGKTFAETLAIGRPDVEYPNGGFPFDSVEVETVMVDSIWKVKKTYLGKFKGAIRYQPSSECKLWLVVWDTERDSASTISEGWEVPLVSHSSAATACNTRPVIKDGDKIHLLYSHEFSRDPYGDCLFYFHTEDAKPWSLADLLWIGHGASMDKDVASWVDSYHTGIFFAKRNGDEWLPRIRIRWWDENMNERFSPPSIAIDESDTIHIAFISAIPQQEFYLHRLMYLKFHKDAPFDSIIEIVDVRIGDENILYSPSLVLDHQNRPHIGFRGGYAYWDGEWYIEPLPDSLIPPSLASWGGNVYMLYSVGNTLFRRYGYGGDYWLGEDEVASLSNLQAFELSNGSAIIWQDGNEISLIFWDPETGGYSPPHLLGTGNYPHTIAFNDSLNKAFSVFTQPDSEDYKVAYTFTDDPYNLAYYYLELGREEPSPFTVHRDSFADEMDIGDSLIYEFPELESLKVYRVLMELYAPCPETVTIFINEDTTEIELPGGELVGIEEDIPVGSDDAWIEIRGDDIGCKRIIIYPKALTEGMGGLGGPQEILIEGPKIFKLYQSYPNPTTKATVIKFQIPVKTAVSLKVYDVSGRVIRSLTRAQSLKPGIYTVEWNGRNGKGMKLPAGVYFYRLETKKYKSTKKLVWVK